MKPEDIDKLFKERLGPSSPTPPADLWNRLQDRIEDEMPASEKQHKPKGFMWLSYSIAAAISLLLAVGIVFYNVQRGHVPVDGMARNNEQIAEQPLIITEPSEKQVIAQVTEPATAKDEPVYAEPAAPIVSPVQPKATQLATIAKAEPKSAPASTARIKSTPTTERASTSAVKQLAVQTEKPVELIAAENDDSFNTGATVPATFASNNNVDLNAQPVEIIIKRAVAVQTADEEELSGFEKKQKLAKNIFKQVRNLSNGERVELSELGINADKIALETQIGKQKISKVINL